MSVLERNAVAVHGFLIFGHFLGAFHCLLVRRRALAAFHFGAAALSTICLAAHLEDA